MDIATYLKEERGRMARVAAAVGMAGAYLSQVANGVRPCPPEYAPALEEECEFRVRRWELRPDDWYRIWPELVGADGAPDVPATREAA